jgi:hypothetical protein
MQTSNISGTVGAVVIIAAAPTAYRGYTIQETAGAVARVRIWDSGTGQITGVTMLDEISLTANQSLGRLDGGDAVTAQRGITVEIVSGTIEGGIRFGS